METKIRNVSINVVVEIEAESLKIAKKLARKEYPGYRIWKSVNQFGSESIFFIHLEYI